MALKLIPLLCLLSVMPNHVMAQDQLDQDITADMQKHFAEAYNRGDLDAMTAAFTKDAVRVTPSGIFQGRDEIRRGFQDALKLGLHDYTVQRVISRSEGNFVFNAGKWQAKLGDRPFARVGHGRCTLMEITRRAARARRKVVVLCAMIPNLRKFSATHFSQCLRSPSNFLPSAASRRRALFATLTEPPEASRPFG